VRYTYEDRSLIISRCHNVLVVCSRSRLWKPWKRLLCARRFFAGRQVLPAEPGSGKGGQKSGRAGAGRPGMGVYVKHGGGKMVGGQVDGTQKFLHLQLHRSHLPTFT